MRLVQKIGSLWFAVTISVLLILLLIVSTSMESLHGTAFAQKMFYQTRWFDVFLSFLWLNIFFATVLRFPFKKHHTAFIITHAGILGLLLGALITRLFAVEGQITLFEGNASSEMKSGGYQLNVTLPDRRNMVFDLKKNSQWIQQANPGIFVGQILERASEEITVAKGQGGDSPKYALRVRLKSPTMGLDRSFWLVESSREHLYSDAVFVGPLKVLLQKETASLVQEPPVLIVRDPSGKELVKIDLSKPIQKEIFIKEKGLKITDLRYYPYARVVGDKLANVADGGPLNPAVDFNVSDKKGSSARYVKFALFPDFESMHHKDAKQGLDIMAQLNVPAGRDDSVYAGPTLSFLLNPKGGLTYRAVSKDGTAKEGKVEPETSLPLGWTDMSFSVEEILNDAAVSYTMAKSSNPKEGVFAAEVTVKDGNQGRTEWITEEEGKRFTTARGDVSLSLALAKKDLPFTVFLKDFRKKDYPGTNNPSSFESDVTLEDPKENVKIEKTISMNRPLDYKGFRIFQSSYIQNPDDAEASVFTVAKNPGISLIYMSSFTIFGGAMLQFYFKQLSRKPNGGKNEQEEGSYEI